MSLVLNCYIVLYLSSKRKIFYVDINPQYYCVVETSIGIHVVDRNLKHKPLYYRLTELLWKSVVLLLVLY